MRILLVTPAPPRSYHGNRITARRWARMLRELGHTVRVAQPDRLPGDGYDAVVALHARRSANAVRQAAKASPPVPVVLALTGTDLYPDLASTGVDPEVLEAADRIVVLQPLGAEQVPAGLRDRVRVIHQSAEPMPDRHHTIRPTRTWDVVLLAHLRAVKDPLLVAEAVRLLPDDSRIRVRHAGAVLDPDLAAYVGRESVTNPRYTWLGQLPRPRALRLLATSRLLVHPSRHEGGANVCSEALAAGLPVVATRIPGTVGILGSDYPGYFPVGDAAALADLLDRAERDAGGFYRDLVRHCEQRRTLVDPARERQAWADLLAELVHP